MNYKALIEEYENIKLLELAHSSVYEANASLYNEENGYNANVTKAENDIIKAIKSIVDNSIFDLSEPLSFTSDNIAYMLYHGDIAYILDRDDEGTQLHYMLVKDLYQSELVLINKIIDKSVMPLQITNEGINHMIAESITEQFKNLYPKILQDL